MAAKKKGRMSAKGPSWSKLKHALGSAKNVPILVGQLAQAGQQADEALDALNDALLDGRWHGTPRKMLYSASGPGLTLLIECLADPKVQRRRQILSMALSMLQLGLRHERLARGLVLSDAQVKRQYAGADGKALLDAALAAAPALVTMLGDEEAAVRELAVMMLGFLPGAAEQSAPASRRLAQQDESPEVRARAIFAAAYQGSRVTVERAEGDLAAGALVIADWVLAGQITEPEAAHDTLVSFFRATIPLVDPEPLSSSYYPPRRARQRMLDDQALALLGESALGQEGQLVAVRAAVDALRRSRPPSYSAVWSAWPDLTLTWFFPERQGGFDSNPLKPNALTAAQKSALDAFSSIPEDGTLFDSRGIPPERRSRRRWLGLDPPSVLEDQIKCPRADKKKPVARWKAFHQAMDEHIELERDPEPDPQSYVTDEWFSDLDTARWLQLWTEVSADACGLGFNSDDELLMAACRAVSSEQRERWRSRYLDECRREHNAMLHTRIGWALALSVIEEAKADEPLPEELDDVVSIEGPAAEVRQVFEHIPAVRRERIAARELLALGPSQRSHVDDFAEHLLDLAPEAASVILERWGSDQNFVDRTLGKASKRLKRVDEILRASAAQAKKKAAKSKAKKKAKRKAKKKVQKAAQPSVKFDNLRGADAADELSDMERKQLAACGRLWDGKRWKAERRLRAVDEPEEGNFYGEGIEIWDVLVDGTHAYDAWMYMMDSGTVFKRGTTKVVLSRIQDDFGAGGGDPALASSLEDAYEAAKK